MNITNWPDTKRLHVHNYGHLKPTKTGEAFSVFKGAPFLSFRGVTWIVLIVFCAAFWAGVGSFAGWW